MASKGGVVFAIAAAEVDKDDVSHGREDDADDGFEDAAAAAEEEDSCIPRSQGAAEVSWDGKGEDEFGPPN